LRPEAHDCFDAGSLTAGGLMNIALWIATAVLAAFFLAAGIAKTFQPIEKLAGHGLGWAKDNPAYARTAGFFEILGSVGLVLSALFNTATFLIPWAAAGLALIMVLSILYHVSRGEKDFVPNIIALVLALFVAWGRSGAWAF
jgi:uncharacterized membrane protein YphA (DoxX/SURF4 family)